MTIQATPTVGQAIQTPMVGAFVHAPRAPDVPPEAKHNDQRRYGADHYAAYKGLPTVNGLASVSVFRNGEKDAAELRVEVCEPCLKVTVRAMLAPAELRELARCLIDAAADIEANPAIQSSEAA